MSVPGLIGRDRELAALQADIARAAGGSPGAVLLTGAPGVGKSRLAGAALDHAASLCFATFTGQARPLSHDVAYAPLVEAFGPLLRGLDGARRDTLIGDLPQLSLLFSGIGLTTPAPLGDPDLERSRLLDGLTRLLDRLAREQPLALLLDDVHTADAATFRLARHLASGAIEQPMLLLLTARPDEPERQRTSELTAAMTGSSWWLARHEIEPLGHEDAAALVRSTLGTRIDPALTDRIVARCAGRPLFLNALARTVAESGRLVDRDGLLGLGEDYLPLPEDVRAQLDSRIGTAAPDERGVLDVLAAAGTDLPFDVIVQAAELTAERTTDALDRLYHRGLIRDDGSGCDLVHDLLRDVLNAELSPIAARAIHARLLHALAERRADDPRLAEHALAAGALLDPDVALRHLIAGGTHALAVGAAAAAVRYLAAAVQLAGECGRADLLADLHGQHAYALRRTGHPEQARSAWQAALNAAHAAGLPSQIAKVEQELGMLDWGVGDLAVAREHFARAAQALDGLAPSSDQAALLYTQMIAASRVGDATAVAQAAAGLRRLAEQLHSPRLTAQAYLAEAVLDYAATDYVQMVDSNLKALAAAEQADDPLLVIRAHDQLSVAAASQLDLAALRRHSEQSLSMARELGAVILEPWPRARLAVLDLLSGNWSSALPATSDLIVQALRYDEQRGAVSSIAGHALVLVHLGRLTDARRYLAQARATARPMLEADRNVFSIVAIADATLALVEGDPARVVSWSAQLDATTGGWMPLLSKAVLGEAHAALGDVYTANATAEALRAVRSSSTCAPSTLADWVTGLARLQAGANSEAAEVLAAATEGFQALGLPFYAARARLARAEAQGPARPTDAVEQGRAALETFDGLGAAIWAKRARDLLRSLGVVPSRGRARSGTDGPLSVRELQVARLVASGRSNSEVASELFISPRTVTTHLDRMYGKLGLSSRVALTRYLADSGLLEPDEAAVNSP